MDISKWAAVTSLTILLTNSISSIAQTPGDVAPRGNTDNSLNAGDVVILQRIVLGILQATEEELNKGDIAPLGAVDGIIDSADLLLLMRAINGDVQLPDNLPPLPPDTSLITVTDLGSGTVSVSGSAGSVESNANIELINLEDGSVVNIQANTDGSISTTLSGVQGDVISIKVTDGALNTSLPSTVGVNILLALNISSPTDGSSVVGDKVAVDGTFTAPVGAAITVNGVVATLYNGNFAANNIPLADGSNTLDVLLVTADSLSVEQQITVTKTGDNPLQVTASPSTGFSPLTSDFDITVSSTVPGIQLFEADLDGDGTYEISDTVIQSPQQHTYLSPGLYTTKFRITDTNNNIFSTTETIGVGDVAVTDTELRSVYNRMLNRLAAGSIDGALNQVSGGLYDKYDSVFTTLQGNLSTIITQLGTLEPGPVGDGMAEYLITRNVGGTPKAFPILFLRGEDGVWRIDGM
jgi:hypothetical protein